VLFELALVIDLKSILQSLLIACLTYRANNVLDFCVTTTTSPKNFHFVFE